MRCQEPQSPAFAASGTPLGTACAAKEGAAMATTKDRLEELTNAERELRNRDVVAPEDTWGVEEQGPPPAAGQGPAVAITRSSPGSRLLEPISGRWAAIGAIAWVLLVGIGIAVEPPPTNPDAVDPWFLNALEI